MTRPDKETVSVQVPIPIALLAALERGGLSDERLVQALQESLALRLFQDHTLSMGQAARLAGMDLWTFTEFVSRNGVPVLDMDDAEFAKEMESVEEMLAQIATRSPSPSIPADQDSSGTQ